MSNYYNKTTNELVTLTDETLAAWAATGNPKAADYAPLPPKPAENAVWAAGEWITPPAPATTAEEHLSASGYTPLRLLTCLDLEAKLRAANATSAPLAAVRAWLDTLTLAAAANPDDQRPDWPPAPHQFPAVLSDALAQLT